MVSYIIPYVGNRYDQLVKNLESLDNQTDTDFEVILVCQNCTCDLERDYMTKLNEEIGKDGGLRQTNMLGGDGYPNKTTGADFNRYG